MDVYGRKPRSDAGKYFRNTIWWWHPLWSYCCEVAPRVCSDVYGHSNDGDGLSADGADRLARTLADELASGRTRDYERRYAEELAALPTQVCEFCAGTGVRSDAVGTKMGMPERSLTDEQARTLGRAQGWCNGCDGIGETRAAQANYPFSEDNVREFQRFVADSGGFSIC
jgi:hypothetical protein